MSSHEPSDLLVLEVNDTRVILENVDPDVVGSDYINANYVRVRVRGRKHTQLICSLAFVVTLTGLLIADLYRTTCGSPATRRFTSPLRGVWQQLLAISGK